MGPKTQETESLDVEEGVPEITAEEYPEWHELATEAMAEVAAGSVERWP